MKEFSAIAARVARIASNNSPVILTAIGVAGVIATGYLAARAAFKSSYEIFYEEQEREGRELTTKEVAKLTWTNYIPTAVAAGCSIACIIMANQIGNRRAAGLAAAVAVSERAFEEYRSKVVERIGANKEQKFRDEIAQDRVTADPPSNEIIIGSGDVLCLDSYSGRYFTSDLESIRRAQNDINAQILNGDMYCSLTELYYRLGLAKTDASDEIGFTVDIPVDLVFSATLHEGKPVMVVSFKTMPIRNYHKFR